MSSNLFACPAQRRVPCTPKQEEVYFTTQKEDFPRPATAQPMRNTTAQPMGSGHHPELLLSSNELSFGTAPPNSPLFSIKASSPPLISGFAYGLP